MEGDEAGTAMLDAAAEIDVDATVARASDAVVRTVTHILDGAGTARDDRLWAGDPMLEATNPLCVAHGACGPAAFLLGSGVVDALPGSVLDWMAGRARRAVDCPPGLFVGIAGIAWTLDAAGLGAEAAAMLELAHESPLLHADPGVLFGAAGWGLAALERYGRTGDAAHLTVASEAGDALARSVRHHEDGTCSWVGHDERVWFGFGHGAAGISLFLARLYAATGRARWRELAVAAMDFDLAHRAESPNGLLWSRYEGDTQVRPYWIGGSTGVGCALLRVGTLLQEPRYLHAAARIADDAYIVLAAHPGLFEGLSGIGEFLLDMFDATDVPAYRRAACDVAETVMLFGVETGVGLAWPARSYASLSTDYAMGGSGVGTFLSRLVRGGPRPFVDLSPRAG